MLFAALIENEFITIKIIQFIVFDIRDRYEQTEKMRGNSRSKYCPLEKIYVFILRQCFE